MAKFHRVIESTWGLRVQFVAVLGPKDWFLTTWQHVDITKGLMYNHVYIISYKYHKNHPNVVGKLYQFYGSYIWDVWTHLEPLNDPCFDWKGQLGSRHIITFINPFWSIFSGLKSVSRCPARKCWSILSGGLTMWPPTKTQGIHVPRRPTVGCPRKLGSMVSKSGWLFQPSWKIISQNGNLPQVGVKIKKYLKPPPSKLVVTYV